MRIRFIWTAAAILLWISSPAPSGAAPACPILPPSGAASGCPILSPSGAAPSLPLSGLPPADTTRRANTEIETQFKIYPSPIWGRTAGFSAGVGYQIDNLLLPGSRLLATAKPGQHLGRYTLTYFAADAFKSPLYGLANVYYETTGHQWYYGLGPASSRDDRMAMEKDMLEAEVRLGVQPLERLFFLQPLLKYLRHDVAGFRAAESGAFDRLDVESQRNLLLSASNDLYEGMAYGVAAGIDLRNNPIRPSRGLLVQAFANRYDYSEPAGLSYDQYGIDAYAFVPLDDKRLALRAVTRLTGNQGDESIPFFLLPSLHGRMLPGYSWDRFFGMDLLAVNLELIVPLFDLFNWAAMDALFSIGAANVYDDLVDQFEPAVSFKRDFESAQGSYPLRPSAAVGIQVDSFSRYDLDLRILLGWGTEGVRLVRFGFVQDLRDIELNSR